MTKSTDRLAIYLEVGQKRTFAGAVEWPGWCRAGRDEASALQALVEYAPRYARVLRPARLGFQAPGSVDVFNVVERLKGDATTDFGAPGLAPSDDARPVDDAELRRLQAILKACWRAFDSAVEAAAGKVLRTGPRGGGRSVDGIGEHVLGAEGGYASRLGVKLALDGRAPVAEQFGQARETMLQALAASAHGEIPERGPRGGARWTPRYFARRAAWHVLDHAWEIEDRAE